jgi:HEAT repeat protein
MSAVTSLVFVLLLFQSPSSKDERPRHPLAPSLPLLTDAENARYEAIVERFIQYDIGKLSKAEGQKAKDDFLNLRHDAIFALIDGFNRAANMEHSCPAVLIGRKIASIIRSTDDMGLISYAKDSIGMGVKARRHMGVVKDLQVTCILRKGFLQNQQLAAGALSTRPAPTPPPPASLTIMAQADFLAAVKNEHGPKLKAILVEANKRQLFDILVIAAARPETEAKQLGETFLDKHVERKTAAQLKELLKHAKPEARSAAARAIGRRELAFGKELIDALSDDNSAVQQAARRALVQLARGDDFGPAPDATILERAEAITRWREWLTKR